MEKGELKKLMYIPIKIIAILTAIIILTKFAFVFYDFIQNPFSYSTLLPKLPKEAVRHVMTSLILLELLALTLHFLIEEKIDPNMILITVLTVIGRDIIVLDLEEIDYRNLFAISLLFAITIIGLYILKFDKSKPDS
jgi:uncharacterized membrane protein (DUF373 family)